MPRSLVSVAIVVAVVALVSGVYAYLRAASLASPQTIAEKGLAAARRDNAVFYTIVSVVTGVIGTIVFRGMLRSAPEAADGRFLLLAIGIGVVFEIMAAIVFRMRGIVDFTVLHLLHIAGYGWILPRVFPR
jgi:hypothetical protein